MNFSKYFTIGDFAARRKKLIESMEERTVFIILSNEKQLRNSDVSYKFRQDSSFWYLTGFGEENSILILYKNKNGESSELLFVQSKDEEKETWEGHISGISSAKKSTGIDEVLSFDNFQKSLEKILKDCKVLYFDFASRNYRELNSKILQIARSKRVEEIKNSQNLLGEQRLIKDKKEISLMRKASKINVEAHKLAMRHAKSKKYEYEIEAELIYHYKKNGAEIAFLPIVASGANSTILHYNDNNLILDRNGLLLIDAGCELENYASDITRTFPLEGKFSKPQRDICEIVLSAHEAAIKALSTKKTATFESVQKASDKALIEGLIDLKILKFSFEEILEKELYKKYSIHRVGHWLGLDVHDTGNYFDKSGKARELKSGMIFTVEPGLYFRKDDKSAPERFRGIGIRIEDDVLWTRESNKNNIEILSEGLPRSIDEIESFICAK